jgi:hypothetical protein
MAKRIYDILQTTESRKKLNLLVAEKIAPSGNPKAKIQVEVRTKFKNSFQRSLQLNDCIGESYYIISE